MAMTLRESFNPRRNSIGFLRWLLATAVIFSHAGPLAGFYGYKNLGTQWSNEQSFGGVAVAGFFFLSGFLITKSRMGRATLARFLWRRVLRIMPAFWAALIATAFLLAPLSWWHVHHTLAGYFSAATDSPLTYFSHNMWLHMVQRNIAGMGSNLPLAHCCGYDWNGSAWTLIYEFSGYLTIGALGLVGFLAYRRVALAVFGLWLLLNTVTFLSIPVHVAVIQPLMNNFFAVMLLTPFFFGMVFALYDHKVVIDDRLALAAAGIAFYTYFIANGWNVYGQFAFLYVLMWCAVRLPLRNWERPGDLSYGIYIYAWPIMQVAAFFHLETRGWIAYHVGVLLACHVAAFLSWHLLEKRALALKNWTPQWLLAVQRRLAPAVLRIRRSVDVPTFSSTRFAAALGADHAKEPDTGDLVTHVPAARVEPRHEPAAPHRPAGPAGGLRRRPRRLRSGIAVSATAFGAVLFVMLGWGLPAIYHSHYALRAQQASLRGVEGPSGRLVPAHPVPTAAQSQTFDRNASSVAVAGRDGYVFLGDQFAQNMSQAVGLRYYSPQEVIDTAATLTAERAWLSQRHIAFSFAVAPAKWDVYSDKLPAWTDGQRLPTIYDQLQSYDQGMIVDLRPALSQDRSVGDTYSRLNSHWTPYGAYVAFRELAARLRATVPGLGALHVPTATGVRTVNAQNEFAGIDGSRAQNNWTVPQFADPLPSYHLQDSAGTDALVPGDHTLDMTTMPLQTTSPTAGNSVRALVLCDSTITSMSPYLAEAFGSTMMVRHEMDNPEAEPNLPQLVASYRPNVVIVVVTERELNYPVTNQLSLWKAAEAFESASGAEIPLPLSHGRDGTISISPATTSAHGAAIEVSATSTAARKLDAVAHTPAGDVTIPIAFAKGPNITYLTIPPATSALDLPGAADALTGVKAVARALAG